MIRYKDYDISIELAPDGFWVKVDTHKSWNIDPKGLKKNLQDWLKGEGIYGAQLWLYNTPKVQKNGVFIMSVLDNYPRDFMRRFLSEAKTIPAPYVGAA